MTQLKTGAAVMTVNESDGSFSLSFGRHLWEFNDSQIGFSTGENDFIPLSSMKNIRREKIKNCLGDNLLLEYEWQAVHLVLTFRLFTDYLDVSAVLTGEDYVPQGRLYFPCALKFGEADEDRQTVLPKMQGIVIPARYPKKVRSFGNGLVYSRDAYLPFFAFSKESETVIGIFHTPYDAAYELDHPGNSYTRLRPCALSSLGHFYQKRVMRYLFVKSDRIIDIAKAYRQYADENGRAKTLKEKEAVNPAVARLYGAPVVHCACYRNIAPDSHQYRQGEEDYNHWAVTFDHHAELLKKLYKKGVRGAYLHYDGWNRNGYDNQIPDVFPPAEACGGVEGMKRLSDTAKELGYIFGIHDQYRDYYFDAPSYSDSLALLPATKERMYTDFWDGGKLSIACSEHHLAFVKRNYGLLENAGIRIDAAYLDVFSAVEQDECVHPLHPSTREDCVKNRRSCLEYLNHRGIITSSEEAEEPMLTSIALCHHAPFPVDGAPFFEDGDGELTALGIPLMALVYHDVVIMPWPGLSRPSDWGMMDKRDHSAAWAALTGNPVYLDPDETSANIAKARPILRLHKRVATQKIVDFDFIDGDLRKMYTVFEDGTRVTVDHDTGEFVISEDNA